MIQFDNAVDRYNKLILEELKAQHITCWLAGGAIRDYFMGVPIKTDYDIFFPYEGSYLLAAAYFKNNGAEVVWESDNGMKVKYKGKKYDLIKKFFPSPQATIDEFDFTVSMFAVDTERVYYGETSFIDLAKRQLMINKITYPASTLSRAFRYSKKGFSLCLGEMKKIIEAIQGMPKEEPQPAATPAGDNGQQGAEPTSGDFGGFFTGID